MKLFAYCVAALLLAALTGCASTARMQEVRDFAAESAKLGGYADLTERFRDTYQREKPYLSPAEDQAERITDAQRRAAYPDLVAIQASVVLYLRTLGQLAGDSRFDLKAPIQSLSTSIKAWPDTGVSDRHVTAYAGLTRLLAQAATGAYQDKAVQQMVREGQAPLQNLLEAMGALLRYYDKTHDNEQRIVLGMLETEIAFANTPRERLLVALARSHQQAKAAEYRLAGLRETLAARHVAAIARGHQALLAHLEQPDSPAAKAALADAVAALRASGDALAAAGPATPFPAVTN